VRRGDSADLTPLLQRWLQQSVVSGTPSPAALDNIIADTLLYSLRVVAESGTSPLYNHAVNRLLQELRILSTIHEQSYLVFRLENYFRELVTLVASSSTAAHDAVTRARQIIHERFATDLSLASVAQEVFVSPFHLSHLFRRMLGMTFLEYLTEYRLQQARVYLEETRDTVAAVAARVGYADPRHFSQLFKKRLGVTPTQHRQRMLARL
jgi:two-component system response regulator YesN